MGAAKVNVQLLESESQISIQGSIDENMDFSSLKIGEAKNLILDLREVRSLNSMGLRNWVHWVKSFRGRKQLFLRHCPRVVVDQMNILQGFLPIGAVVESIFVPYYCESCDKEENVLAQRGRDYMEGSVDAREGQNLSPTKICPHCGKTSEMDVIPAKYFGFLKYRGR